MVTNSQPENKNLNTYKPEFPGSPVSLDSPFYIERKPWEDQAYAELTKPGSLIRVRAPKKMGKSSLMLRLIAQSSALGYQVATIDFQQADREIFANTNKFFRWLCRMVARQLKILPNLDDYWDEDLGSKLSSTIYFESYLFEQIETPLVVVLNEVNLVFEHPEIAQDFLPLLRFWHEQARHNEIWQKLHLIVIHSTEVYVSLSINKSPFNVGLSLKLPEFSWAEVQDLAQRYQLNLTDAQIEQLTEMLGGHPYLVHLAFYHLHNQTFILEKLLETAPTQTGIYRQHLQNMWVTLQEQLELGAAVQKVIASQDWVQLEPIVAYQLESMGLVKLDGNLAKIDCDLYRLYFQGQNLAAATDRSLRLQKLEQENNDLKVIANLDPLTKIANRRQFDRCLEIKWNQMAEEAAPLSLILGDIDYFKYYNDTYGHQAGDDCLRQIAQKISNLLEDSQQMVARIGGEEFAVILPRTDVNNAMRIAEKIRVGILDIAIPFMPNQIGGLPSNVISLSLGVASMIPSSQNDLTSLFVAADAALYESKKNGRNCTTLSSGLDLEKD
ncbi:MAG: diguanylate cyclase [Kamptonema sp. SIO1D9]|nr:diguanylate cyclase [Kamptonema sp. SIO1D9]